jgi:hypothetical protein
MSETLFVRSRAATIQHPPRENGGERGIIA